jgi:hypothetical protein
MPQFVPVPFYNSSKLAMNAMCLLLEEVPVGRSTPCVPDTTRQDLTGIENTEETDAKRGAIRAVQLVLEGPDGVTGT